MRRSWAAVWVGVVTLAALGAGYALFVYTTEGTGKDGYKVHAFFRDALGLYDKTEVRSAGLGVGKVFSRTLDPEKKKAKIVFTLNKDFVIYSNALVAKRAASLLGEFYLDIDPGSPVDTRTGKATRRLQEGDEITEVAEATGMGEILDQVGLTLPLLKDIMRDVKELTGGPVKQIAENTNNLIEKNAVVLERLLLRIDNIAADIEDVTRNESDDLKVALRNVREITEGLKDLVGTSKGEVASTGGELRSSLQKLQRSVDSLDRTMTNVEEITDGVKKGEGTVGKLLTDDDIAENIEQITEDAGGFIRSVTKLQTVIGLRTEFNALTKQFKNYFHIQLSPRPDRFYLIEIVDDPRGLRRKERKRIDTSDRGLIDETTITTSEQLRFSLMFGQRLGFATGRFGIKESTGGVGIDLHFFDDRLTLSTDLFDTRSNQYPRLQARANVAIYKQNLFLVGGVDDVLNQEQAVASGGNFFDWFLGFKLQFKDEDLKTLLLFGGSAAGSATSK